MPSPLPRWSAPTSADRPGGYSAGSGWLAISGGSVPPGASATDTLSAVAFASRDAVWLVTASPINGLLPGGNTSRLVVAYLQDPTPFYLFGRAVWVSFQVLERCLMAFSSRFSAARRSLALFGSGSLRR